MDFGTIQTQVQGRCQDTAATTLIQIQNFINQVVRELVVSSIFVPKLEGSETITTAASTATYDLPSDFDRIYDILQKDTPSKLTFLTNDQFDNLKPNPGGATSAGGKPLYYTIWGVSLTELRQISFYPIPDDIYTIYLKYFKILADMTAATDLPAIPVRWHWLIVQGAYAKICEYNEDTVTGLAYQEYYRGVSKFMQDMEREVLDAAPAIRIQIFDQWARFDSQENPLNQS